MTMRNLVGLAVQQIATCSPLMASYKLIACHRTYGNHGVDNASAKTLTMTAAFRNGGTSRRGDTTREPGRPQISQPNHLIR